MKKLALLLLLAGCAGGGSGGGVSSLPPTPPPATTPPVQHLIKHIVIIVQENRTVDNLFAFLPGADAQAWGFNTFHRKVKLRPVSLTAPYDMNHDHIDFQGDYREGNSDGWNLAISKCKGACPPTEFRAYAYVPQSEVQPYYDMARQYGFANRMFQTNEGPSFPAHQYLISGTSTLFNNSPLRAADNPTLNGHTHGGGCDSTPGTVVPLIDPQGNETQTAFPCFDRVALPDEIDRAGLTWRYYQQTTGAGLWNGIDAIHHLRYSKQYENVRAPSESFLTDVKQGLTNVTWITPSAAASDHALRTNGSGPSWVASIVNAIGQSSYWKETAIVVVWDDWGGWYDHVVPIQRNSYELGYRVPLIVISPWTQRGYISKRQHEFGSILRFVESTFGIPTMGTTDAQSDDLGDFFDFAGAPRPFTPIKAPKYHPSLSEELPDD